MPGSEADDPADGQLTAAVRARIARPQVAADPQQTGRRGVWTTRGDVLTSRPITDGDTVTATWAGATWQAIARWDRKDPDVLWLITVPTAAVPQLRALYNRHDLIGDIIEELIFVGLLTDTRYARLAAGVILDTHLDVLYDDVDQALDLAIHAAVEHHPKPPRVRLSDLTPRPRRDTRPPRQHPRP